MKSALTQSAGLAREPRDFQWLEKNIPCQHACPARTDIPGYLAAIARGDFEAAYRINLEDNVFPAVLGRVCCRPCEEPCRHGWEGLGEPVAICFSKRSAADFRAHPEPVALPPVFPPTGRRVAVVGAGVAGLAAARELARAGHAVTVYEKHARPGGMLRQGIPPFRLPREHVDREIRQVELAGVTIECGVEIGPRRPLADFAAAHDATIVAAGTLQPNRANLRGADLVGVEHGLDFLRAVNEDDRRAIGRTVAVIGGGFTAMDCARAALRLGASSVRVFYRRTETEMRVTPGEREELDHEGIPMEFLAVPVEFLGADGRVRAVRFRRARLGEPGADGRRAPVDIPGSEFEVAADTVLLAIGQTPDRSWLGALADDPRVFLAGDYATGATSLIEAIGHAKAVARRVDAFLAGADRWSDAVRIEDGRSDARTRDLDARPRQPMPALPPAVRALEAEVETGLARDTARAEAERCYLCHYKYEIDTRRCLWCNLCVEVKPRPACIVTTPRLREDEAGRVTGWDPPDPRLEAGRPVFEYYINQQDCIRCNACLEVCPAKCISVQKVSRCVTAPAGDGGR